MLNKVKYIIILAIVLLVILYVFLPKYSKELLITYPYDGTLFPPEIAPPTFRWDDAISGADFWNIMIEFEGNNGKLMSHSDVMEWTPKREMWETIKNMSLEKNANVTIRGVKKSFIGKLLSRFKNLSKNNITISTSADSVDAPIFYRDVPLPFDFARERMELIQWRLGDISKSERPPVILENMPVCGNCHSFTPDGSTLAMDVDSGGDKGSYAITPIEENIFLSRDRLITWSDYKREENKPTFGLLARISPDGRYVASAVQDRVIFLGRKDLTFSQLFFPVKGIIAIYDRETKKITSLPGADNPDYVQGNPVWSADGKYVIFSRMPLTDFIKNDKTYAAVLSIRHSAIVLGGEEYIENPVGGNIFPFNLYRVPFNGGKGGNPEPIKGASYNDKSNYFPKFSPDGKWVIFCQARSFMLLQPDSKLYIMPADFSREPRLMNCNTNRMNSWHSWSPNSKWLVFSSKVNSAYTELFLTHIDEEGNDTPPVLLSSFSSSDRARNIPEFVNIEPDGIKQIHEAFVDYYSYARKGDTLITFNLFQEAENSYRTSIELNPDFPLSHRNLGTLLAMTGRIDEAEKELMTALKLDQEDAGTQYNLGIVYLNRNELDKAQKFFETSKKLDSNYATAYEGMGKILYSKGDIEGARKELLTALKLNPFLPDANFQLGMIYLNEKEYDKAESAFRNVLKNRLDSDAFSRLGRISYLKGNYDRAEIELESALKINPNNIGALNDLGIIYMYRQEFDKAEKIFRAVYQMNPNNPNVCFMLGKVLSMDNRTIPEAISMFSKVVSLMPTNTQGYIELGNLYLKIGNKKSAIAAFEKAVELNPDLPGVKALLDNLK